MTAPKDDAPVPSAADEDRAEARARMRRKLADAQQRHDAAHWARLRERFGLPTRAA